MNESIIQFLGDTAVFSYFKDVVANLEILIGGIFGMYVILLLFKIYETYMFKKSVKQLNHNISTLNHKMENIEEIKTKRKSTKKKVSKKRK